MMRSVRLLPLFVLSSALLTVAACAADGTDDVESGESDLTTEESRVVLALVNDPAVTADELIREAGTPATATRAIVARRDGEDGRAGTADDDRFDSIRELDDVPGVGPATIKKLFDYAKRKGLAGGATGVTFSPSAPETSHLTKIVGEIERAQASIDIAIYSYSDAKITAALASAVGRGVKVRIVYEDAGEHQRADAAARASTTSMKLETAGADVRFVNKTMHHKFMIVDGPRDSRAKAATAHLVSGSANWSSSAASRYDENTLFFSSEEIALGFQREFNLMWAHSRDFTGKNFAHDLSSLDLEDAEIPDSPTEGAYFTSANFSVNGTTFSTTGENTVANALVKAIEGAQTSIHIASGHLRSRPVSEALIAKKAASPNIDIKVYLDGQEFIAKTTHASQVTKLETCLDTAGDNEAKRRACTDKGFLFGYQVGEAGVDVRYKYYAYRWDHSYAPQMHHKYMVIDGKRLFTGSYNLSDNAEHDTFENMLVFEGASNTALVKAFEDNFASMWKTGEGKLSPLTRRIETSASIPLVFEPMSLSWSEVNTLKAKIRTNCDKVDTEPFRTNAAGNQSCPR